MAGDRDPGLHGEKKLEAVWWALRSAAVSVAHTQRAAATPFAVEVKLHPPRDTRPTTAGLVKGLMDGVVCAFQAHQDTGTSPALAEHLSPVISSPADEIEAALVSGERAVLGSVPRLVYERRAGVQWAPADHMLVAGRLIVMPPSGETWRLAGGISEVQAR
jgi:hypothetical protein